MLPSCMSFLNSEKSICPSLFEEEIRFSMPRMPTIAMRIPQNGILPGPPPPGFPPPSFFLSSSSTANLKKL